MAREPGAAFVHSAALCWFIPASTYPELPKYAKQSPAAAPPNVLRKTTISRSPSRSENAADPIAGNDAARKFVITFPK